MKRVCVITGTRAEYGLLKPIINKIHLDSELELQLLATGMHLSPEFGLTFKEIEHDGYPITDKIEILLSSDTTIGITKSMGLAMISFGESFNRLKPDLIIVLGDRYEIFAAVSAASIARIPVAHLHGGETTEGAFDEAFRHSITKMSYLHFTSTEEYKKRVIQLGEDPSRVFNVGAIGVESIKNIKLLKKEALEKELKFKFGKYTALVTYHPVTLEHGTSEVQFSNILKALNDKKDLSIIFTKANSDTDGRIINNLIDEYVLNNKNAIAFTSMGQLKYLSALRYSNVIVGNSSSGILEAPYFRVPTVNIGDRQKGRVQPMSILNCPPKYDEIRKAIDMALSIEFNLKIKSMQQVYGNGDVSEKIINIIKKTLLSPLQLKKKFFNF